MKMFTGIILGLLTACMTPAFAGVQVKSGATLLGAASSLKCSTGITCTKSGSEVTMVAASPSFTLENDETLVNSTDDTVEVASNDADMIFSVLSPLTSDGDASLLLRADNSADSGDDWKLVSDGATNDLLFQNDKTGSMATYLTLSEVGDMVLGGTTPYFTIGDAGAEDAGFVFDGNAQDFNISLDDSTDDLVIGLGSAAGTTDAIRIDENQDVTIVQGLLGLGTDEMVGFLQNQVAATATTLTAAQCGSTVINDGAVEIELPEASTVLGCRYTFITGNASNFDVDPDGGDQILILTNAAGDAIRNATVGNSVTIEAISASAWAPVGKEQGTYSDIN